MTRQEMLDNATRETAKAWRKYESRKIPGVALDFIANRIQMDALNSGCERFVRDIRLKFKEQVLRSMC